MTSEYLIDIVGIAINLKIGLPALWPLSSANNPAFISWFFDLDVAAWIS
jgi:hypothetical protein